MKRLYIVLASAVLFASCQKQEVKPSAANTAATLDINSVSRQVPPPPPPPPASDYTSFCYASQQVNGDFWEFYIYQHLGTLSTAVSTYWYKYDYFSGGTSGTIPWTQYTGTFPAQIGGVGLGYVTTNIQIKETRCLTGPFGTNCNDKIYNVGSCTPAP